MADQETPIHKSETLTDRVLKGLAWLFVGTGATMASQILVLAILSRLLSPAEFGLVAAAMVIINFAYTISNLGLGPAITQRPVLTTEHIRTGFTVSLVVGLLMMAAAPLYIPILVQLFNMEDLAPLLRVVVVIFPLRSLGLVAESLVIRELRFYLTARIEVIAFVLGYGAVGVILAVLGYGSWALVYATITQVALRSALFIIFQPHSKMPQLHLKTFAELMNFGTGFTLARIGNTLALQGDNFVIGRWLGADALGLYGRAYQLMVTPAVLFGQVIDKVLFPAMSKVQNNRGRLTASYRRGIVAVAFLAMPASAVMYILAPEIIAILLGQSWLELTAPFQILVFGTLFRTSYRISDSIARATGRVYQRAWRQAVYAVMVIGGAWIGHHWGLNGVAIGVTGALIGNFLLMASLSLSVTSLTWKDFTFLHLPPLLVTTAVAAVLLPLTKLVRSLGFSNWLTLLLGAVISIVTAVAMIYWKPKYFFGPDGDWIKRTLLSKLPEFVSRRLGQRAQEI